MVALVSFNAPALADNGKEHRVISYRCNAILQAMCRKEN